ncbi:MAG TPA: hypothetical protein H9878_03255 [Candidatus Dietzia merdigallinarum]|nr:hypothetical protein [Candidatus Dietzia merdigallinarum]
MANADHPTHPTLKSDDITHYRHVITRGRQQLVVEVVSLVDGGEATPPILSTFGDIDLSPDQAVELADALGKARTAWDTAHRSWVEGLR